MRIIKNNIIFIGIVLVALIGYGYFQWLKTLPQNYTIGEVVDIYKPLKGSERADFSYYISKKEYRSSIRLSGFKGKIKVGQKYLVEIPEDHSARGILLLMYPVPDSVEAPIDGWDEKPDLW